jgi:hypothetical protein
VRFVRNPDRRKFTGPMVARWLQCISSVGLHPITGFYRYQHRRHHVTLDPNEVNSQYKT